MKSLQENRLRLQDNRRSRGIMAEQCVKRNSVTIGTAVCCSTRKLLSSCAGASFTIEAAVVVPIVLFALAGMISLGLWMHDIVIGNMTANETAELYSYRLEDEADSRELEQYGETRLGSVLSDMSYSISIDRYGDGSRVQLSTDKSDREYELNISRPEKLMRQLTIIEELVEITE